MELETTKQLLESRDPQRMAAAARDLGRQLAATSGHEWLRRFQRLASRVHASREVEYDRGFVEALELVAAGFEHQEAAARRDESEIRTIVARKHWAAILRLLDRGVSLPSDLAGRLGVSRGLVTRLIDELEAADLVIQAASGKLRPCRLTPRARIVLERLPPEAPAEAVEDLPVEQVVPAVVGCMGMMSRDRRAGRQRLLSFLENMVSAAAAPRLYGLLQASLQEMSLAVSEAESLVSSEAELQARLEQQLAQACRGKTVPVVEKLRELASADPVMLRVGGRLGEWDVMVRQQELENIHVIRDDDLQLAAYPSLDRYQVVYESPSLLVEDRRAGINEPMIQQAIRRSCFGIEPSPPTPDFERIPVALATFEP